MTISSNSSGRKIAPGIPGRRLDLPQTISRLPKIDLHRHLEGAFTPKMILAAAKKFNVPLPASTEEGLKPFVQITPKDKSLIDFLKKFDTIALLFQNKEIIRELTYRVIEDSHADNIKYMELRFAPHYMVSRSPLFPEEAADAALDGINKARKDFPDMKVEPMLIAVRNLGPEKAAEVVKMAVKKGIPSIDLASDELHYPPELFKTQFTEAREKGLHVTIHAGEALGADSVRTAILECGAERIGHGVRAAEDPLLVEEIRRKKIPLEICPTSNVQTGAVQDWRHHPVRQFFDSGVMVTVNTDDPGISGITLSHEYQVLIEKFGFSLDELRRLVANGADAAFLVASQKKALKARLLSEFDRAATG